MATPTRYEVAFAKRGAASQTLRVNDDWIGEHLIKNVTVEMADWGVSFERVLRTHAQTLRGSADLGDALIFAVAEALRAKIRRTIAIATRNRADFEGLPVTLVDEFLNPVKD